MKGRIVTILTPLLIIGASIVITPLATAANSDLEGACIRAGTAAPVVLQWPAMYHAGVWPLGYAVSFRYERAHPPQIVRGMFEYPALEPPLTTANCAPRWRRVVGGRFLLEKAGVRGDPGSPIADPGNWTNLTFGWQILGGLSDPTTDQLTNDGRGINVVDISGRNTRQVPAHFNSCVGGRFRRVDYVARDKIMDAESHKTVAQAFHVFDARVHGNCKAAAASAKRFAGH